ncbi:hypothetical protein PUNSTDRAFT_63951, partial [Punctularia strigosozonata HHB-11173 SS5]|uniref:uncharacterized protein n=1 Tax=Punctularia strigosozonata (strain HHB-11173) TaxID=741275 RepID=UPI000441825C
EHVLYNFTRYLFSDYLENHGLLYRDEIPASRSLSTILEATAQKMDDSVMQYGFTPPPLPVTTRGEGFPLHALHVVNKGILRKSTGQIHLRGFHAPENASLNNLVQDRVRFNLPCCIEDDHFVLHLGVIESPLQHVDRGRIHTCMGLKLYSWFPQDRNGAAMPPDLTGNESSSGGEEMEDMEDIKDMEGDSLVRIRSRLHQRFRLIDFTPTRLRLRSDFTLEFLPSISFYSTYIRFGLRSSDSVTPCPYPILTYTIDTLPKVIYEAATANTDPHAFRIQGSNVSAMADLYLVAIGQAITDHDFQHVPSPNREFQTLDDHGISVSFGAGLEREVTWTAMKQYLDQQAVWYLPCADGRSTLKTQLPSSAARWISDDRLLAIARLGALTSLCMIHGFMPGPIDPCIIQFAVHGKDINALHPSFIGEWHPELRKTILDWIAAGPAGNLAPFRPHFATWHDMEVLALQGRTPALHDAMACEMLYRTIIGPEPHLHPEWEAFFSGLALPCAGGFNLLNVITSLQGGSETFLNLVWTSHISSFSAINGLIRITDPAPQLVAQLQAASQDRTMLFSSLVRSFLSGSGIPCPGKFEEVRGQIGSIIDLSKIDDAGFRSQHFVWAATGSPFLPTGGDVLMVDSVDEASPSYAPRGTGAAMARQGKISFRTCFRMAHLPIQYILALVGASYLEDSEPRSLQAAVDHWLLCECSGAIGGHTIA